MTTLRRLAEFGPTLLWLLAVGFVLGTLIALG
jgi:hypothetical protein